MAISASTFSPNLSISSSPSFNLPSTASIISRRSIFATAAAAASTTKQTQHHRHTLLKKLRMQSSSPSPATVVNRQTLSVYEINEGDRRSPAFLKLSKLPEKSLGDLVTFSNKLYSGDLSTCLGITAGMIMYIEKDDSGDRYEAVYSFYFGNYGHVSVQGPYFSGVDSELAVTGGTGVFEGVRGKVKLVNVAYPFKLFYTFDIYDVGELPKELVGGEVVKPSPANKN